MITKRIEYDDQIVRMFSLASIVFGAVGMIVGVLIASQLAFHQLNLPPFLTFARLRPLHTNAVIFAFVGNMMFAGVYYSMQRLLKVRLASDVLSRIHFWGWQVIIVAAAISLPLGYTTGKEYAELEWPIDIAIALIWVVFAVNFFWTIGKRNEKNLYVAIWFYIATVVTVAVLHIMNSLAIPIGAMKSYSIYGGVQDALVQWWYGHNAVAFFLTTPILGIMYYFLPKAAERPVYSYRLSIVHFWSLVFMYIWAGPHHLLGTALPEWAQSLGMVFSLMLWAPSWGGMLNGLLTLKGAWGKLRTDPVLKFFAAGVTFYGMATFEGPLLSIKSVSALAHYTDWIVGHAHGGALGWNGLMAAGMFYWLWPRLYGKKSLHSVPAAEAHFWIATVGIMLYMIAMWVAGVTQGLMWRATNPDGSLLYPDFVETLIAIKPLYIARAVGGTLYLVGFVLMIWNLAMTAKGGERVVTTVEINVDETPAAGPSWLALITARPIRYSALVLALTIAFGLVNLVQALVLLVLVGVAVIVAVLVIGRSNPDEPAWHGLLEGRALIFTVLTLVAVLVGGVAELLPTIAIRDAVPEKTAGQTPYTPLELEGRDLYVREGCYTCHSQMIRSYRWETQRYGPASRPEDSHYDHPFQWGSKRTGPDLAREGGKYPNLWHYQHLMDPRSISTGSNMPDYAWLADKTVAVSGTRAKVWAMQKIGVRYSNRDIDEAATTYRRQAERITTDLAAQGVKVAPDSEMVALIGYLQRLGKPRDPADAASY